MTREQKGLKLLEIVENFVVDQKISCADTIYQSDRVIENAYELIEQLADVAGYLEETDD